MDPSRVPPPSTNASRGDRRARKIAFAVVTTGYLAVTAAESLLAPLYPILGEDLDLHLRTAGFAFGLLAAAIAVGSVAGGLAVTRLGPKRGALLGLAVTSAGAGLSAASGTRVSFLLSQVLLGLGSGGFFASGLTAAGLLAGTRRRGLAIGMFGVAFSAGLASAALLAALAGVWGWRMTYVVTAAVAGAAAVAVSLARVPEVPPPFASAARPRLRQAFGRPLAVGGVAAASQYGIVAFLPAFAVSAWGMSPASAALILGAARILSVPAKLVSGGSADQAGALKVARSLGLFLAALGAWWTMVPGPWAAAWAAVLFAAFVSGLGPLANLLAFEGFGERGALVGVFRSAQIGLAAAMSTAIGGLSSLLGLRTALAIAAVTPAVLLLLRPVAAPEPGRPDVGA